MGGRREFLAGLVGLAGSRWAPLTAQGRGAGAPARARPEFIYIGSIPTLGGVATVMTAQTVATHECGDHTLFVGHILSMTADDSPPLVYHAGKFGALASGV